MTDHANLPLIAVGDWIDPVYLNGIRDNFMAMFQGLANAGSLPYAIDANTVGELTKPASAGILTNDNAGAMAWLIGGSALQVPRLNALADGFEYSNMAGLHTIGIASRTSDTELTDAGPVDIPSLSITLALTKPCTVVAMMLGSIASNTYGGRVMLSIDGALQTSQTEAILTDAGSTWPLAVGWYRTGRAAGSRIVKAQYTTVNNSLFVKGNLIAMAFEEV